MGILSRFAAWAIPTLPPVEPAPIRATLDASAAAAMERYASIANALAEYQQGRAIWPAFDADAADAGAYRKIALVFRCLNLIAHAAGTAKVRVYDESADDEEIADHPMRKLIRQPNARTGEARFWGTVALRAGVAGFCVVEKERDGFGDVIALNPLVSSRLKAIPRGRGRFDWEYKISGRDKQTLKAEDVIVFTWADTPDGSPYGQPPLATAVRDVAILDKLTQFVGNLLDRGGIPMWMLFPKMMPGSKLDQAAIDLMEERFARRRGGFERRGMPWIAEGFDKAERLSYDVEELAMQALRDLSELAIVQAFGVPPRKAGIRIGLEHTTQNATAQVEDAEFYRDTIVPLWSRFDDALTTGLLPDFEPDPESGISLEFDYSEVDALQEDRNDKAQKLALPGFAGGLLSNHMAMRELGITVPDGLPEYYLRSISVEAIPADDPLQLTTTTTTTPPPQLPATTPPPQLGSVRILQLGGGPAERLAKRQAIGRENKKHIAAVSDAREPSIRRFLTAQADRLAETVAAPMGVALARSNGHAPQRYSVAEIDWTFEQDELSRVLRLLYQLSAETAFDAASNHLGLGIAFDLANPRVQDVMERLGLRVVDITQQTRDVIADIVTKGEQAGKGITEIADDIRASTGFSQARANVIARTESMVSFNSASALAYKESGVVTGIEMLDNPGHNTDPLPPTNTTCADRDGKVIGLDESDDYIASAHPNCVLAFAPIVGED